MAIFYLKKSEKLFLTLVLFTSHLFFSDSVTGISTSFANDLGDMSEDDLIDSSMHLISSSDNKVNISKINDKKIEPLISSMISDSKEKVDENQNTDVLTEKPYIISESAPNGYIRAKRGLADHKSFKRPIILPKGVSNGEEESGVIKIDESLDKLDSKLLTKDSKEMIDDYKRLSNLKFAVPGDIFKDWEDIAFRVVKPIEDIHKYISGHIIENQFLSPDYDKFSKDIVAILDKLEYFEDSKYEFGNINLNNLPYTNDDFGILEEARKFVLEDIFVRIFNHFKKDGVHFEQAKFKQIILADDGPTVLEEATSEKNDLYDNKRELYNYIGEYLNEYSKETKEYYDSFNWQLPLMQNKHFTEDYQKLLKQRLHNMTIALDEQKKQGFISTEEYNMMQDSLNALNSNISVAERTSVFMSYLHSSSYTPVKNLEEYNKKIYKANSSLSKISDHIGNNIRSAFLDKLLVFLKDKFGEDHFFIGFKEELAHLLARDFAEAKVRISDRIEFFSKLADDNLIEYSDHSEGDSLGESGYTIIEHTQFYEEFRHLVHNAEELKGFLDEFYNIGSERGNKRDAEMYDKRRPLAKEIWKVIYDKVSSKYKSYIDPILQPNQKNRNPEIEIAIDPSTKKLISNEDELIYLLGYKRDDFKKRISDIVRGSLLGIYSDFFYLNINYADYILEEKMKSSIPSFFEILQEKIKNGLVWDSLTSVFMNMPIPTKITSNIKSDIFKKAQVGIVVADHYKDKIWSKMSRTLKPWVIPNRMKKLNKEDVLSEISLTRPNRCKRGAEDLCYPSSSIKRKSSKSEDTTSYLEKVLGKSDVNKINMYRNDLEIKKENISKVTDMIRPEEIKFREYQMQNLPKMHIKPKAEFLQTIYQKAMAEYSEINKYMNYMKMTLYLEKERSENLISKQKFSSLYKEILNHENYIQNSIHVYSIKSNLLSSEYYNAIDTISYFNNYIQEVLKQQSIKSFLLNMDSLNAKYKEIQTKFLKIDNDLILTLKKKSKEIETNLGEYVEAKKEYEKYERIYEHASDQLNHMIILLKAATSDDREVSNVIYLAFYHEFIRDLFLLNRHFHSIQREWDDFSLKYHALQKGISLESSSSSEPPLKKAAITTPLPVQKRYILESEASTSRSSTIPSSVQTRSIVEPEASTSQSSITSSSGQKRPIVEPEASTSQSSITSSSGQKRPIVEQEASQATSFFYSGKGGNSKSRPYQIMEGVEVPADKVKFFMKENLDKWDEMLTTEINFLSNGKSNELLAYEPIINRHIDDLRKASAKLSEFNIQFPHSGDFSEKKQLILPLAKIFSESLELASRPIFVKEFIKINPTDDINAHITYLRYALEINNRYTELNKYLYGFFNVVVNQQADYFKSKFNNISSFEQSIDALEYLNFFKQEFVSRLKLHSDLIFNLADNRDLLHKELQMFIPRLEKSIETSENLGIKLKKLLSSSENFGMKLKQVLSSAQYLQTNYPVVPGGILRLESERNLNHIHSFVKSSEDKLGKLINLPELVPI